MKPVCLIIPPSVFLLDERVFINLGILKVAAVLEARGYPVEVLDLSGVSNYETVLSAYLDRTACTIFGITATTPQFPAVMRIQALLRSRRPQARLILGGPHPTLVLAAYRKEVAQQLEGRAHRHRQHLLDAFDVIVAGDGELTVETALTTSERILDADDPKSPLFLTNEAFDQSPFPARHLVDVSSYHYEIDGERALSLIAQLGCPFACGFSVTADAMLFGAAGPTRLRDVLHAAREVQHCEHGCPQVVFESGHVVASRTGWNRIETGIQEGVRRVFRVHAANGLSFKATSEHPVWVLRSGVPSWVRVGDLRPGDQFIMQACPTEGRGPVPVPEEFGVVGFSRFVDEKLARFLGIFVGCGRVDDRGWTGLRLDCVSPGRLGHQAGALFGLELHTRSVDGHAEGWLRDVRVSRLLAALDVQPSAVPGWLFRAVPSIQRAFWAGVSEATTRDRRVEAVVTASEGFSEAMAHLLFYTGLCPHRTWCGGVWVVEPVRPARRTKHVVDISSKTKRCRWHTRPVSVSPQRPDVFHVPFTKREECAYEIVYDLKMQGDPSFVVNGFVAHNCSGRTSPSLRNIRLRTTESVLREVEHLYEAYQVKALMFYDDELNVNPRMLELMAGLTALQKRLGVRFKLRGCIKAQLFTDQQAAAMAAAGFRVIFVGFESGHPRILENINKKATRDENSRCRALALKHGIKVKASMSLGHPGESLDTVHATRDWLLDARPDDFNVTIITSTPGTFYYDRAVQILPDKDVWTYTVPNGDRLHSLDVDYRVVSDYYNGRPTEYRSFVYTDFLSAEDLVRLRDDLEFEVRQKLRIPFSPPSPSLFFDASMGQTGLPPHVLRRSQRMLNDKPGSGATSV